MSHIFLVWNAEDGQDFDRLIGIFDDFEAAKGYHDLTLEQSSAKMKPYIETKRIGWTW